MEKPELDLAAAKAIWDLFKIPILRENIVFGGPPRLSSTAERKTEK